MIYFRCPTCKTLLANKQLIYEKSLQYICKNPKLNDEQINQAKMKVLDQIQLHRPCCRMRFLGYVPLIEIIK